MKHTPPAATSSSFEHLFFISPETYIHPTAIVGPSVVLGNGSKIGPYTVITGNVTIGDHTQIHAHAMIGSSAQAVDVTQPLGRVVIGSNTIIKEFVTIGSPASADGTTSIGDNCFIMNFAHIAHDVTLENNVVMTNNAQLAGHAHIEQGVVLMANSSVHQRCRIGSYTAISPYAGARQDVPPYGLFVGQPAGFAGLNRFRLKKLGYSVDTINALKTLYTWFYRDKVALADLYTRCAEQPWHNDTAVQKVLTFIQNSNRGISRQRINE